MLQFTARETRSIQLPCTVQHRKHTTSLDENMKGSVPVMLTRSYGSLTATTASVTSISWSTKNMLINRRVLVKGFGETMSSQRTWKRKSENGHAFKHLIGAYRRNLRPCAASCGTRESIALAESNRLQRFYSRMQLYIIGAAPKLVETSLT